MQGNVVFKPFGLFVIFGNGLYPADCSRKTRQALRTKALKGEFIGSVAAYGYKKSSVDKHLLEIDESTAPVVERIFKLSIPLKMKKVDSSLLS